MFAPIICLTVDSSKDQESSIVKTESADVLLTTEPLQGEVTSETPEPDLRELFSDTSGPAHGNVS